MKNTPLTIDLSKFLDNSTAKQSFAERFDLFESYYNQSYANKHLQYMRESHNGSEPLIIIKDQYSGKFKSMINLASNDYLNLTKHTSGRRTVRNSHILNSMNQKLKCSE